MKRIATTLILTLVAVGLFAVPASASDRTIHIGCDVRSSNGSLAFAPYWMIWNSSIQGYNLGSFRISESCSSVSITVHGFRNHPDWTTDMRVGYVNNNGNWVFLAWHNAMQPGANIRLWASDSPTHPVDQRFMYQIRAHVMANRGPGVWGWDDISF